MENWKRNVAKEWRVLLEVFRDHIVSNLYLKENPYSMWNSLTYLFHNNNYYRKLVVKEKISKIKMEKGDVIIQKYLTRFTQFQDEIGSVGLIVTKDDLVSLEILGLPKSWHKYQYFVNGREKLPEWEPLWFDLVQEEIWRNTRDGSSSKNYYEESCALEEAPIPN